MEGEKMSRNTMIILILLVPLGLWLNLYAYYKYGRSLIKKLPYKKNRQNTKINTIKNKGLQNKKLKNNIRKGNKKV
jgi:ACR3 family arsenite efflux pump ArsB